MKKNSIYLILVALFIQCGNNSNITCKGFFDKVNENDTSELKQIFKMSNSYMINNDCVYRHEFTFWYGDIIASKVVPYFQLKGKLFQKNNVIYLDIDNGNTIRYFDFNLLTSQASSVDLRVYTDSACTRTLTDKKYDLILEDKFYDESLKDSIYCFRFNKIGIMSDDDDLVFYVGYHSGIKGIYNSIINNMNEEVFSKKGVTYDHRKSKYNKRYVNRPFL